MFLHVRLQLTYLHAWTCTFFGSRWSARPWIVFVVIQAAIVYYYHYVHDSLIGWLRPYLILFIWSSLDGWAHTAYTSCTWDISSIFLRRFSDGGASVEYVLVKHFTPLSLRPHTLGGICYTAICHRPYHSPSRTMEDPLCDLWTMSSLENTFIASLSMRTTFLLFIISWADP